ncbi:MAG: lysine--tRNA ligase [Rickettsiales bacterium]|nr:lysine--tRNA ligase [Rickettsiales bacterium]
MNSIKEYGLDSKVWPFELAREILKKIDNKTPKKGYVLFCTGYGPSGLPHIGTYGEVVRTMMVKKAFETISDIPTKLFVISDDMDGLRKIPENIPNPESLVQHLQKPLTSIPDPFGESTSYGHYMNARLNNFLMQFDVAFEFKSATELYKTGVLDEYILKVLDKYDEIMSLMLPTLGEERQQTFSPILPICPRSGRVLYVPIINRDLDNGTVSYHDPETNEVMTTLITGGHCKLQWKTDLGTRWAALDVDFEMYGKDHLANSVLYTKICHILGGKGPTQFFYEMFLDNHGQKISKSKGNGLSTEEWLEFAPIQSLSLYIYQSPRKAKRLFFDVIPKSVDEYMTFLKKYHESDLKEQIDNPVWHIYGGNVPKYDLYGLSFSLLINLACTCNPTDTSTLWGFISKYAPNASPVNDPFIDHLADYAIKYYNKFIKPHKIHREPTHSEKELLRNIKKALYDLRKEANIDSSTIQNCFYNIAQESLYKDNIRDFFKMVYEVLLGQSDGPRLGSFVLLYGIDKTIELIKSSTKE